MEKKVSVKNTKNEIIDAYNELLDKLEANRKDEPKKELEKQKQTEMVQKVAEMSQNGIVKEVSELKMDLTSSLDKLSDKFVAEFKKFEELQQAIEFEKKNLEELYQLSANTDSLAVILLAQKEKKEQFEKEMLERKRQLETEIEETKTEWKKEKKAYEDKLNEETEELKKKRQREEEEYNYTLAQQRKKDDDSYEEQKTKQEKEIAEKRLTFEKEIAEREAKVSLAETELKELRKKSEAFPKELEIAVQDAIEQTREKMEIQFKFEKELTEKQTEGELKLKEQTIGTLQAKIKDLEAGIKELGQKANNAELSVKDIAIKAIESSSKIKIIDKAKEIEKNS